MKKGGLILGGTLALFLLAGAALGGAMRYGSDSKLPDGFSVGGLSLGGMEPDDALKAVHSKIAMWEGLRVSVDPDSLGAKAEAGGDSGAAATAATGPESSPSAGIASHSLRELGLRIEAKEGIRSIEKHRSYDWWERAKLRYRKERGKAYGIAVSWDEDSLKRAADQAWSRLVEEDGVNAARAIDDRDIVVYTAEKMGRRIDLSPVIEEIRSLMPSALTDRADDALRLVRARIVETPPDITLARLKEEGLERKISEFSTSFKTSAEGRSHNIEAAAMALNDTLLQPGEVFEYSKIVAKAEEEYGYKEAPVILHGKLVPGIGGGICQVSSTLYNAALLAGLEIVERRNHSLPVNYLPRGLDATYADGYVNFKFRNSTGRQLLIRTVVKDKTVTVKLFGTMDERESYRTETAELKVNPPKTVYVANPEIAFGSEEIVQQGENGYVVEAYLVKLFDGAFAEKKKLSRDTYRTQDTLIAVHPDDPRLLPEGAGKAPEPDAAPAPGEPPLPELPEDEGREFVEPV
ncbi:VanW family protein [Paenibacillaceae bacterium WGS1546]|uniref:VanW family protein n=1 Tax=Cohnella sp. WGS1546 TaxID=3366810 RepID=UPI00372D2D83